MRAFPLIRTGLSNERIMAVLFFVILLYLLPGWLEAPSDIPAFFAVLSLSLLLDATAGFLRHKRLICSVSAAVTAAVLHVLTPGIPLWGRLIGIFAAIIPAKQLWGGTGKNILNPAIVGYLTICILFTGKYAPIAPSTLLLPALLLSLPFIAARPFVSVGYLSGMLISYLTGSDYSAQLMLMNSVFFGCIVLTDPVTVTPYRISGLAGGFLIAFVPQKTANHAITLLLLILIFNLISYLLEDYFNVARRNILFIPPSLRSPFSKPDYSSPAIDLSGNGIDKTNSNEHIREVPICNPSPEKLLDAIRDRNIYGMGGAAFPTAEKIRTVMYCNVEDKYFIINGVECDPGLIHDKWLLRNRADDICKGILTISGCIKFREVILAVKNKDGLSYPDGIKIHKVGDYYPVGFEKTLIRHILKKNIPVDFIPAKIGILVLNVQTVLAVYEALYMDKKSDTKYLTAADLKEGTAKVVKVRTGQTIKNIIDMLYPERQPVFAGGGLMQSHMADDGEVIERETNFIAAAQMPGYKESPLCSNCNVCTANCPQGLMVQKIAELVDQEKFEEVKKYRPEKCIKCGLCSYVCLAGRNLSARVAEANGKVLL